MSQVIINPEQATTTFENQRINQFTTIPTILNTANFTTIIPPSPENIKKFKRNSRVLAVVPCRAGSKGLPNKNILKLNGRYLMDYAVRPALQCTQISRVLVSTESKEYARIAESLGAEVPFLRPLPLAEDVPTEDVILHVLDEIKDRLGIEYDIVVTLQATTPGIRAVDITQLIHAVERGFDSAATVCEISENPEWMFTKNSVGEIANIMELKLKGQNGVRQSLNKRYKLTGAGYATSVPMLRKNKAIITGRTFGWEMNRLLSTDIDNRIDFDIARMLLSQVKRAGMQ